MAKQAKTQRDDILKKINTLQLMLGHSAMMGDSVNKKKFQDQIDEQKSILTHIM